MFRFAHPYYIYLLALIPIMILIFYGSAHRRKKILSAYGNMDLLSSLMPEVSGYRVRLKFYLLMGALAAVIFTIAGPQFGTKISKTKRTGIEMIVALDVSNSMMAKDVSPSRIDKSKQILSKLIDEFTEDKFGLIVFAGNSYVQLPITSDYVSAKMFLQSINPGMVPQQGTAIGSAINMAIRSFGPDDEKNSGKSRTIIVITDGENHEDDALSAAKIAAEKGIKVNVVGVGTTQGSPIPIGDSGNFFKDKEGSVVITRLNEQMCQEISAAGGGVYVRADNSNGALRILKKELEKLSKSEIDSVVYSEYDEQFQYIAWIALILLLVEFFILGRKNGWTKHIRLFS